MQLLEEVQRLKLHGRTMVPRTSSSEWRKVPLSVMSAEVASLG